MSISKTYNDKKTDIISIHLFCLFVTNVINYAKERTMEVVFNCTLKLNYRALKVAQSCIDSNEGSLISNLHAMKCNTFCSANAFF